MSVNRESWVQRLPASRGKKSKSRQSSNYQRYPKPPYPYTGLIAAAIWSSPNHKLTLANIYLEMARMFPFFKYSSYSGWNDSVRHTLSHLDCFIKVPKDVMVPNGKGCYWTVQWNKLPAKAFVRQNTCEARTVQYRGNLLDQLKLPHIHSVTSAGRLPLISQHKTARQQPIITVPKPGPEADKTATVATMPRKSPAATLPSCSQRDIVASTLLNLSTSMPTLEPLDCTSSPELPSSPSWGRCTEALPTTDHTYATPTKVAMGTSTQVSHSQSWLNQLKPLVTEPLCIDCGEVEIDVTCNPTTLLLQCSDSEYAAVLPSGESLLLCKESFSDSDDAAVLPSGHSLLRCAESFSDCDNAAPSSEWPIYQGSFTVQTISMKKNAFSPYMAQGYNSSPGYYTGSPLYLSLKSPVQPNRAPQRSCDINSGDQLHPVCVNRADPGNAPSILDVQVSNTTSPVRMPPASTNRLQVSSTTSPVRMPPAPTNRLLYFADLVLANEEN